ncbi:hypothetical protein OA84_00670 [Kaistella solincola]|uniref:Lipocalin-like domain-containing protein n=1 Tax=Kaistella solincola TaxID=510955 RepID=A0ABR4ZU42_9FLAO|nr:hypothetical protein [Kaistella solincola]KIA85012.1 hypothetical protein OA84_00670 [Kaistella solincola]
MKFSLLFLLFFGFCLSSCDDSKKENQLKEREKNLLLRETEFAVKKQDYESLLALRDSLENAENTADTIAATLLPQNILGKWNGKMVCTESSCAEHVIGDQRNDTWIISAQQVIIINKSGSEHIYTAKFTGSEIKMSSLNNTTSPNKSDITLQVPAEITDRIKGNRELTGKDCVSKFSVELEKIKN